jgi:hypothetical protein
LYDHCPVFRHSLSPGRDSGLPTGNDERLEKVQRLSGHCFCSDLGLNLDCSQDIFGLIGKEGKLSDREGLRMMSSGSEEGVRDRTVTQRGHNMKSRMRSLRTSGSVADKGR